MSKKILILVLISFLVFSFSGCSLFNFGDDADLNKDIPKDPGTTPPVTATGTLSPSFSASILDASNPNRVAMNLGGLIDPGTGIPIDYDNKNIVVVEDGVVKGIKVTKLGEDTVLNTDIVFIIDTTGSMGPYITGVKNSILSFLDYLHASSLDVRVGALAYADGIPPASNPADIPSDDRAAYTVVDYTPLSSDLSDTGIPYGFVDGLYASYKGYGGGAIPEGLFDSLWWAHESFDFRSDAQKIYIVVTDAPSWGKNSTSHEIAADCPWTDANLAEALRGEAVVHVVSPDGLSVSASLGRYDPKYLAISGGTQSSPGTGGYWYPLTWGEEVDLSDMPIIDITASSALVEFVTSDPHAEHTLRVIITGSTDNGETTRVLRYLD